MGLVETTPLPLPVYTSTVAILEASRDWMLETWSEVGSLDLVMLRLARDLSRTTLKPAPCVSVVVGRPVQSRSV